MTDVFTSVLHPFRGYRLGRRLRSIAALSAALFEVALRGFVHLNLPDMVKPVLRFFGVLFHEDGSMVTPGQSLEKGTRHQFKIRTTTDAAGNEYHLAGPEFIRPIDGQEYITGAYGGYRHDTVSKEAQIARRERELADLKAA